MPPGSRSLGDSGRSLLAPTDADRTDGLSRRTPTPAATPMRVYISCPGRGRLSASADMAERVCPPGPFTTPFSPIGHSGGVERVSHSEEPAMRGAMGPPSGAEKGAKPPCAAAGTEARRAEARGMAGSSGRRISGSWLLAGLVSSLAKLCMPCTALAKLPLWMGSMPLPPLGMPADAGIVSGDMPAPDVGEVAHPSRLTGPANGCGSIMALVLGGGASDVSGAEV
mmetsp:Transcript_9380/g.28198  ORF Transcript_9380/g.28198 Transcript_9380/m.28198 type:complete len:225 (+) Transcript_9380:2473-3147(+)